MGSVLRFGRLLTSAWLLAFLPAVPVVLLVLKLTQQRTGSDIIYSLLIYIFFVLFVFLVKKLSSLEEWNAGVQKDLERRIKILQLQGVRAQIDPHLIFNILNTVASLIYLDDREAAYDYMIKFTQFLRFVLNDAEEIFRPLSDELDMVKNYLDLEKLRFGDKFDYVIEIDESISQKEIVPRFMLQTFAEDAVTNGIVHLPTGGMIKISVKREGEYLRTEIEDNGKSHNNQHREERRTSARVVLTGELYSLLNQMSNNPIRYFSSEILTGDNTPYGTRSVVLVPVDITVGI